MKLYDFFAELKRRNVYEVAIAYAAVGSRGACAKPRVGSAKALCRLS